MAKGESKSKAWIQKLASVEENYDNLSAQLSDPKVISNQEKFQKLSKEHSDLTEVVSKYREFKEVDQGLEDSRSLLSSGDPEMEELAREEVETLEAKHDELSDELQVLLLPRDPFDGKNVLLEIRAGTGGEEASLFAAELFRAYLRFGEKMGWKTDILSKSETGLGGLKEIVVLLEGKDVYGYLKYEGGVHRVQRIPVTETSGRIHTSAVTVAVLPEAEEVEVKIEAKDLRIDVMRAGGPGGQSVNTTDSAVRLTHIPSGLVVICQDEKSQHKNKAKAMKVLMARLLEQEQAKQNADVASQRRAMVGSGDRSERIRTYNFPQNRLTDHRIGMTLHKLDRVMEGEFDEVLQSLKTHDQMEQLQGEMVPKS